MSLTDKQSEALNLIWKKKELLDYYLKTESLLFFEQLKEHSVFSFASIPNDAKEKWMQMSYLINAAKKISTKPDEYKKYAPLILDIFDGFLIIAKEEEVTDVKKTFIFNTFSEIFLFLNNNDISVKRVDALLNFCPPDAVCKIYQLMRMFNKLVDKNIITTAEIIVKYIIKKMITLKSNEDYTWNLSEIAKNHQFIQNCSDTFVQDILKLINENTSHRDIVSYEGSDKKSKISLSIKENTVEAEVVENEKTIRFLIPVDIEYSDRASIVRLVQDACGQENSISIASDIKMLYYTVLWNDYSYHSISSLFKNDNDDYGLYDARDALLKFIANLISKKADTKEKKEFIDEYASILTKYKNPCNKRILLYVYGSNFKKYRNELMSLLINEKEILFHCSDYEGELYNVLHKNVLELNDQEQEVIKDIIEKGPYTEFIFIFLNDENQSLYKRHWQKQWFSTLTVIPKFQEMYNKFNDLEKEWFNVRDSGVRTIIDKSPIAEEEITKLLLSSPKTLVEKIIEFDGSYQEDKKDFFREKPTPDGLRDSLQSVISNYPEETLYNMSAFLLLPKPYITSICRGLRDTKKEYINYQTIVKFILRYINQDGFWSVSENSIYEIDNFIMAVSDIISGKISKIPVLAELSITIIEKFIKNKHYFKIPFDPYRNNDDYIFELINNTLGRTLESALILAYRNILIKKNKKDKSNIWFSKVKRIFEQLLTENSQQIYILLGYRFQIFYYLDEEWILKINSELNKNSEFWKFYFQSYVLSNSISNESYRYMMDNYIFVLEKNTIQKEIFIDGISKSIANFFLYGVENLSSDASLIKKIFIFDRKDVVQNIVNFLGWKSKYRINNKDRNQYDKEKYDENKINEQNDKILLFWEYVYSNYRSNDSYNTIMASTVKLLPSVRRVSIAIKNQIEVALNCGNNTDFDFISDLLNIITLPNMDNSHVENCNDILCYYLKKYGKTVYFKREDMINFATFLKNSSQIALIDTLCDQLVKTGCVELANQIKKI